MTSKKMELLNKALDAMFFIAPYARIAHFISGRIRLKFSYASAKELEMGGGFAAPELIREAYGIKDIKVNRPAGSVTIEYDPTVLPDALWQKVVGCRLAEQDIREMKAGLMKLWQTV